MLYPLPAVLVSVADRAGKQNLFTVAWTGTICSSPAMVAISVRPERYSHHMIEETGEFVINLTTEALTYATDYCGVRSGRDENKWESVHLTPVEGTKVKAPYILESPVNIECKVTQKISLGTHDMFLANVVMVHVSEEYLDDKGTFHLEQAHPIVYSHGTYFSIGDAIGTFGYSVKKQVSAGKVADKTDKKVTDKKATDKKATDKKIADKKTTDKKTAVKKISDKKSQNKKTQNKKTTNEKTINKRNRT